MKYDILIAFREHLDSTYSKNTARTYYTAVKGLLSDFNFNDLSEVEISYILEKLSDIKTKNRFSAAKNGLKELKKFDSKLVLPEEKVFKELVSKKRNRVKSKGKVVEFDTVLRKINSIKNERVKYAYRLAIVSGLRVSEIAALKKSDVQFLDNNTLKIHVRNGKGGKAGKVTTLPDQYVYEKLKKYIETLDSNNVLFHSESTLRQYAWKNNLETHDFRRIFSNLLKRKLTNGGIDKEEANNIVKKQLRHARFSNTKRYLYGRKVVIKSNVKIINKI